MNEKNLYDSINTTAARWLYYNRKKVNLPLGVLNFKKNDLNMWFLHMLNHFSIFNNYEDYYINCNIFMYIYLKYIKKFKHLKRINHKQDLFYINPEDFTVELLNEFNISDISIISRIYNTYYRRK